MWYSRYKIKQGQMIDEIITLHIKNRFSMVYTPLYMTRNIRTQNWKLVWSHLALKKDFHPSVELSLTKKLAELSVSVSNLLYPFRDLWCFLRLKSLRIRRNICQQFKMCKAPQRSQKVDPCCDLYVFHSSLIF